MLGLLAVALLLAGFNVRHAFEAAQALTRVRLLAQSDLLDERIEVWLSRQMAMAGYLSNSTETTDWFRRGLDRQDEAARQQWVARPGEYARANDIDSVMLLDASKGVTLIGVVHRGLASCAGAARRLACRPGLAGRRRTRGGDAGLGAACEGHVGLGGHAGRAGQSAGPGLAHDALVKAATVPQVFDERIPGRLGERFNLCAKGPLFDADGRVMGLFGVSRGMTESRRAAPNVRCATATPSWRWRATRLNRPRAPGAPSWPT